MQHQTQPAAQDHENQPEQELNGNRRGDMGVKTGHLGYQIEDSRFTRETGAFEMILICIIGSNHNQCQNPVSGPAKRVQ